MYKKILVPLDGSGLSECVFQHVKAIAAGCSVPEVDLIFVVQQTRFPYSPMFPELNFASSEDIRDDWLKKSEAWGKAYLKKVAADFNKGGIASTKTAVLQGNAPEKILEYTEKNGVDLIVMSSHGSAGPTNWPFGGTAEKVVRSASVPVLVVRPSGCGVSA